MRRRLIVRGRVQGVGFRPWVWQQATRLCLTGTVKNTSGEVHIEVHGDPDGIDALLDALRTQTPPLSRVDVVDVDELPDDAPVPSTFAIAPSLASAETDAHVPPESAPCRDCLSELEDPNDRRFGYPFTQCTACGPRYTLIEGLPYDRARTSMSGFALCERCQAEYTDPASRRFHAEPIACPDCGPQLRFDGASSHNDPLEAAVERLRAGDIVAVRGVGGYHLMCDASSEDAVTRLRTLKQRPTRPLALLVPGPTDDPLRFARALVQLDPLAQDALLDPSRPIVLAPRQPDAAVAPSVAPGVRDLGVMLPSSGLHHLLARAFDGPLVATSGNRSGEPLARTPEEAREHLGGAADAMLHHDRPIVRPVDDAVVRMLAGMPRLIRGGRGFAPIEIRLPKPVPHPLLATGGHLKSTVALAWGDRVVLSPHIGELEHVRTREHFERTIDTLCSLYAVEPHEVLSDAHPDYASTRWAERWAAETGRVHRRVRHHFAHASSLVGEYLDLSEPWLVFAWDGVGLGPDGTLWGGEAFYGHPGRWTRVARLSQLRILGAPRAGREPWRAAAAMCWDSGLPFEAPIPDPALAHGAWQHEVATARTSAIGRLFDGAAHLITGISRYGHEAQGPMELEALAETVAPSDDPVHLPLVPAGSMVEIDWRPLMPMLLSDEDPAVRASALHDALVDAAVRIVQAFEPCNVGVTGGVFTNRPLCERLQMRLAAIGRTLRMHRTVPPGDGGLSFGQLIERVGARP
jgi:hydrogenase maturation protein HypF